MSKIGKQPVIIPQGVEVNINNHIVTAQGEKGKLELQLHHHISVEKKDNQLMVIKKGNNKLSRSLYGLTQRLLTNLVNGVKSGFEKKLEIKGVGYRAQLSDNKLVLNVGYSHPVEIISPQGITFKVEKNIIIVSGIDKQLVGQAAANIRKVRKPEPYKGKGIRYFGELIKIKAGKAAKSSEK